MHEDPLARASQSVVGVYNSYYSGRNASYMEMIANAGLVGIHLASAQPQAGVEEIRIPSERAFRERERRRVQGIVLERKVVEALHALAAS